jgi:hypothetical protein
MPSRTVRIGIPMVKTRSQRLVRLTVGPGGPSAKATRTVRLGHADCPRAAQGPSARSTEQHPILKRIMDRPPRICEQSARKRIFSKTFAKKCQILNKYHKLMDRPPQWPGLSAQYLKIVSPYNFQRNPFTKRNCHSSKCNVCKFFIQVGLSKVKPMIVQLSILSTRSFNIL